ncbi:hypothetical protein [Frigidibacter sp. ROC022]|uniref:hypothetical protein n=1 Tax=Frigidibacter sp. ROC022 TaxID=2971796 RepID=UPI00215A28AF|nr:hypothetical protein [Frigidibacter sp. ROC022]MCR8724355.1 hypothetical protein [Frigidibacter sp. ROC022]
MQFAADILLLLGALGAMLYCIVLSRRLRRFTDLEQGVGGAIAVLSAQVDDMTKSLQAARKIAQSSAVSLDGLTERAESASRRLEVLMASLHDLPEAAEPQPPGPEPAEDWSGDGALFLSQRHRVAGGAE